MREVLNEGRGQRAEGRSGGSSGIQTRQLHVKLRFTSLLRRRWGDSPVTAKPKVSGGFKPTKGLVRMEYEGKKIHDLLPSALKLLPSKAEALVKTIIKI